MSINLDHMEVEVRERRLHSTLSYSGTACDLNEKSKLRQMSCKLRTYGQCGDCAEECAEAMTVLVQGAAIVSHAPIGCGTNASVYNIIGRAGAKARNLKAHKVQIISTNLREEDTVYGGEEKLRKAIMEADTRFKPALIFIQGSCASGIIGEDLESVADEMQEELGYPILPVYCEGFKSRIWSSGFDAVFHSVLRRLVRPPRKKQEDLVNVFNFAGSDTFIPLLGKLSLRANCLFAYATVEQLATMSEAACSTHVCETLSTYVTAVLEEQYGVPEVKASAPFGIDWTDQWLREIARITGREALAEQVIRGEHERIRHELEEIRAKLKGKRVYIYAGDAFAHNMANVAKDLGLELIGITTLHHDQHLDGNRMSTLDAVLKNSGDIKNYSICNKQPYQVIKLLKNIKPDLLIVRHINLTVLGTKLGIPTLFEGDVNYSLGYDGVIKLGRRFCEAILTKKLLENIADNVKFPYSSWWMEQKNPFCFEGENEE